MRKSDTNSYAGNSKAHTEAYDADTDAYGYSHTDADGYAGALCDTAPAANTASAADALTGIGYKS